MKNNKQIIVFILGAFCLLLAACGKGGAGTYYPDSSEMKDNLEKAGYRVEVTNDFHETYTGTHLFAEKNDEYIDFYWLNEAEAVEHFSKELKEKHQTYNRFISMSQDENHGTLVFCGTNTAVKKSGISIVEVKVKVN